MPYSTNKSCEELWAIVDKEGRVFWSRGGSSTSPKLMVYDNEKSAKRGLSSSWTKQAHKEGEVFVKKIYDSRINILKYIVK